MKILIRNISQIVSGDSADLPKSGKHQSDINVIENGLILIENDKILYTGKEDKLSNELLNSLSADTLEIQGRGKVAMPGFVDAHTHFVYAGSREDEYEMRLAGRTYQQIAEAGGGIRSTVKSVTDSTAEDLKREAQKRLRKFFRYGTTTIEGKSGYGLDLVNELKLLRILNELKDSNEFGMDIIPTFLGAHSIPDGKSREEFVEIICNEMIPVVEERKLSEFIDIFIEEGYFGLDDASKILSAGVKHGLTPRVHTDQFRSIGGIETSLRYGAVSLDHLEAMNEKDMEVIYRHNLSADRKTVAGLLPGVSYFLGISYAPGRKLIDYGIPVLIATDFNPGSCMSENMQIMMSLASTQMKLTAEEILNAVTINAAYSLGLERVTGTIETGKQADILLFDMPSYKYLIYDFAVNNIEYVIKKGKVRKVNEIASLN